MQRRLWLLVGAAVAVMILALSASAMTKVSGSSRASALAAAPFAQAWANVPKTTAGRKAKSILVFGGEQDGEGHRLDHFQYIRIRAQIAGQNDARQSLFVFANEGGSRGQNNIFAVSGRND